MCSCDYDMPSVYSTTIHAARKKFRCEECRREIAPGEKYERTFGVWGGQAGTYRTCSHCRDARVWTNNNVPCLCYTHGNVLNDCGMAIMEAKRRAPLETPGLLFGFGRRLVAIKRAGGSPPRNTSSFDNFW